MTAAADTVWRQKDDLAVVDSPGRVVVLDLERLAEAPQILEGSAAAIWRAVDGVRTTSGIVTSVAETFGVSAAEVEADVVVFLESLAAAGLLEVA